VSIEQFIYGIPKAELHVHIEGTFEPEKMFEIAQRNNIQIKYNSVKELKDAYKFNNLQEFLDIYYAGTGVLINEIDFYEMTWDYMQKLNQQNVRHAEIFFDPQTHTERGIAFSTVITGIHNALMDAESKFGISSKLIMCFLRHLSEEDAFATLDQALDYKDWIIGVGLDSSELGHPPAKFKNVFEKTKSEGFLTVAHAGEEGPPEYVWEAIELLNVQRIDHGNRALEDRKLIELISKKQIPLTVCPLSNLKLRVVKDLKDHPIRKMLDNNLLVTINSDDPAFFGGGLNKNYLQLAKAIDLNIDDIFLLAKNSFTASFLSESQKQIYISEVNDYYNNYNDSMNN